MARLRATHQKVVSAVAVSATIASAWAPPAGRRVRLMGATSIRETSGTPLSLVLTDGTAAASGTIAIVGVTGGGVTPPQQFGGDEAGIALALDNELGMKTLGNSGTISATLLGREEGF